MRKTRQLKIDDLEITVRELKVKEIIRIADSLGASNLKAPDFRKHLVDLLPLACDLDPARVIDMAPSELKHIYDAFREVNAVFFDVARSAGLGDLLKQMTATVRRDFSETFAALSSPDTPAPQSTA